MSRPSLWTNFDCVDGEKTRIYFERSKSSPIKINLSLKRYEYAGRFPGHPFFQIIPHATGRLKSLFVEGALEDVQATTSHLSHPAPLLEHLSIRCYEDALRLNSTPTIFAGDLSSLRKLYLSRVRTELPWRNMVNLTSFTLTCNPRGAVSVGQFLDFFESTPYLEEINLSFTTPTTGAQNGRLVSLACLKSMNIKDSVPSSVLLDHLLIPVGAKLEVWVDLPGSLIWKDPPKSLDNLKNFSDFTTIELRPRGFYQGMKFSGPNGQFNMIIGASRDNVVNLMLQSLGEFDTSKTKRFEIDGGGLMPRELLHRALLPMKDLHTLTLFKCSVPQVFISALQPTAGSSETMVCPNLEELVLVLRDDKDMSHITPGFIQMAAARASRGEKPRTIRIVRGEVKADPDVSKLRGHGWNVEYDPGVGLHAPASLIYYSA